jgi:large subunit ribosomal protein L10
MSKQVKQLEMDALKTTFKDVRDMVVLSTTGVGCTADNQMRLGLRKKNIRLHIVKNSLARRVFDELGVELGDIWSGPTALAWGAGSLAELSRELAALAKKNDKIKFKGAVSEGAPLPFERALTMPTRTEAIARAISLALSPASRLATQILSPAARVAGQLKTLGERSEGQASAS